MSHLDGYHPLHLATEMDHVNINSSPADSSVIVAVVSNSVNSLSLLLQHGATPDVVNVDEVPALLLAIPLNHSQVLRLLLKHSHQTSVSAMHRHAFVNATTQ